MNDGRKYLFSTSNVIYCQIFYVLIVCSFAITYTFLRYLDKVTIELLSAVSVTKELILFSGLLIEVLQSFVFFSKCIGNENENGNTFYAQKSSDFLLLLMLLLTR